MMSSIRYSKSRGLWQILCVGLVLMGLPQPSRAATEDFTVLAVGIDDISEKADADALDYARKRAVYLAIKKMGIPLPEDVAARITDEQMAQIIRGTTVTQQKRDGTKTYKEFNVSINDVPLRKAVGLKDVQAQALAEQTPLRPVLVLPAMVTPKKVLVWDKENTLRAPLSVELLRQGHGVLMMPGGDLADLRLIDGENIGKVKMEELKPMFERYGTDEIILAIYTPGTLGTMEPDKVLLRRLNAIDPHDEAIEVQPEKPEEEASARIARVAQALAGATVQIASSTSQTARQKLDAATHISVHFVYTTPRELATMTDAIRTAPGVMLLEMPSLTLNNVTGTIYLNGDKTALHKVLAAKGIITRDQGGEWTVSTR